MTDQPTEPTSVQPSPEVRGGVEQGVARLLLDRPRAINALTPAMMSEISSLLHAWAADDAVTSVELHGEGERGFCSGADVRAIRQLVLDEPAAAVAFFEEEYAVNELIAGYPKPVTSFLHGISMGGGLGLALHAGRVLATDDLALAMPETGIGLFPDVGVSWQLAHAPGQSGAYLAMSGATIDAMSARWAGLVTEVQLDEHRDDELDDCELAVDSAWIDECFAGDDPAEIVRALADHPDPRARQAADVISSRCPLSVAVALEAVRRAATMEGVADVLAQDLVLARNFVADSDFCEGVRAQLVDKDRTPHWSHASLAEVSRERVLQMFR